MNCQVFSFIPIIIPSIQNLLLGFVSFCLFIGYVDDLKDQGVIKYLYDLPHFSLVYFLNVHIFVVYIALPYISLASTCTNRSQLSCRAA